MKLVANSVEGFILSQRSRRSDAGAQGRNNQAPYPMKIRNNPYICEMSNSPKIAILKKVRRLIEKKLASIFPYLPIGILVVWIAISRTGLMSRFPWEDLYWNDLQIHNSWRWFNESVEELGLLSAFMSVTDFRQNTGDFFIISTKWTNPLLDIGAWFSLLSDNYPLAFILKFIVLSCVGGFALQQLIIRNPFFRNSSTSWKAVLFSILFSSIIFHPLLHGEVGPLNQWYLMLLPGWILILSENDEKSTTNEKPISFLFILLTVLSLGSSDLFFISTITSLYLVYLIKSMRAAKRIAIYVKQYCFIILIFAIDRSPLILEMFQESSQYASKGSWLPGYYLNDFLYPLFGNTILIPQFEGPASLFINIMIVILIIRAWQCRRNSEFLRLIGILSLVIILLILSGIAAHSIPQIRNSLPSAIRYHLTFIPFAIISIIGRYGYFLKYPRIEKSTEIVPKQIIYFSSLVLIFVILGLNISSYSERVPPTSRSILSPQTSTWYTETLPTCVNNYIEVNKLSRSSRSFVFVKQSGSENYMNDSLLILSELPDKLRGRTFQQWRYSVGILNANLLEDSGSTGLFSRPFLPENLAGVEKFTENTFSPFVLSTEKIRQSNFRLLGVCKFPKSLLKVVQQNPTLGQDIYVYHSEIAKELLGFTFLSANFASSYADFFFTCPLARETVKGELVLPVNFQRDIQVKVNGKSIEVTAGLDNELVIKIGDACLFDQTLKIHVNSKSEFNLLRMLLLIFMTITFPLLSRFRQYSLN